MAASRLLAAGKHVAVVEQGLIGGECACIPSKTLLRPPEAGAEVARAAGVSGARLDWPATRQYRDQMIRHLDDSAQVSGYAKQGATVVKGTGRITAPSSSPASAANSPSWNGRPPCAALERLDLDPPRPDAGPSPR